MINKIKEFIQMKTKIKWKTYNHRRNYLKELEEKEMEETCMRQPFMEDEDLRELEDSQEIKND